MGTSGKRGVVMGSHSGVQTRSPPVTMQYAYTVKHFFVL